MHALEILSHGDGSASILARMHLAGLHLKVGSVADLLVWVGDRHGAVDSASFPEEF